MDGDASGAQETGSEQQGQQGDPQAGGQQPQDQQQQAPLQVMVDDGGAGDSAGVSGNGNDSHGDDPSPVGEEEYRAALADRDRKIAELEGQIAEAAKSVESANALTEQIEQLKASADEERIGFELKLAGARNVTAAKALLGEHGNDVAKLKAAEPWLFADGAGSGASGLEPAGAAKGGDSDLKRWRLIAGLED